MMMAMIARRSTSTHQPSERRDLPLQQRVEIQEREGPAGHWLIRLATIHEGFQGKTLY